MVDSEPAPGQPAMNFGDQEAVKSLGAAQAAAAEDPVDFQKERFRASLMGVEQKVQAGEIDVLAPAEAQRRIDAALH